MEWSIAKTCMHTIEANIPSQPREHLNSLQCLRAIAACAVVFHHGVWFFTKNVPESCTFANPKLFGWIGGIAKDVGAAGVDVFFVLSGFIMVYISRPYSDGNKTVLDFIVRRLIRIYPLYALVTLYYAGHQTSVMYNPGALFRSLLFVPYEWKPGVPEPVLGIAWTLYYEVLFYGYFAVSLFLGGPKVVQYLSVQRLPY